jgi:hypothetical protein
MTLAHLDLDIITIVLAEKRTPRKSVSGSTIANLEDLGTTITTATTCRMEARIDQGPRRRKNLGGLRTEERKIEIAIRAVPSAGPPGRAGTETRNGMKMTMKWVIIAQSGSPVGMLSIMTAGAVAAIGIGIGTTMEADLASTTIKTEMTRTERDESGHGESVQTGVMLMKVKRNLDIDHVGTRESMVTIDTKNLQLGGEVVRGALQLRRPSNRRRTYIRWNGRREIARGCSRSSSGERMP